MTEEEQLATEFETHRSYLHAIAFRMLGSHADADDAVQEAWLRLARTGRGIGDLRGWLTTVTGRICLDALRRRGVRGEQPLELSVGTLPRGGGRGLPDRSRERALPFDAIATIIGRSTAATKMLASRARRRVRLGTSATGADAAAREVVDAFLAAVGRGDLAGLLAVLAPEVEMRARGPERTVVIRGAGEVAAQATMAALGRGGPSGARRRCPGRPHHGGRAAGHGRGLHGRGRRRHRDRRADRPRPAGPGRPLVGRVTVCDTAQWQAAALGGTAVTSSGPWAVAS